MSPSVIVTNLSIVSSRSIEGRLVERIALERALEGNSGALLVAGSQHVRAEIRVGTRVIGIELYRTLHELDRLVEAVVAGKVIAGDSIDLTVARVDREDVLRALLEFR